MARDINGLIRLITISIISIELVTEFIPNISFAVGLHPFMALSIQMQEIVHTMEIKHSENMMIDVRSKPQRKFGYLSSY